MGRYASGTIVSHTLSNAESLNHRHVVYPLCGSCHILYFHKFFGRLVDFECRGQISPDDTNSGG